MELCKENGASEPFRNWCRLLWVGLTSLRIWRWVELRCDAQRDCVPRLITIFAQQRLTTHGLPGSDIAQKELIAYLLRALEVLAHRRLLDVYILLSMSEKEEQCRGKMYSTKCASIPNIHEHILSTVLLPWDCGTRLTPGPFGEVSKTCISIMMHRRSISAWSRLWKLIIVQFMDGRLRLTFVTILGICFASDIAHPQTGLPTEHSEWIPKVALLLWLVWLSSPWTSQLVASLGADFLSQPYANAIHTRAKFDGCLKWLKSYCHDQKAWANADILAIPAYGLL